MPILRVVEYKTCMFVNPLFQSFTGFISRFRKRENKETGVWKSNFEKAMQILRVVE